MPERCKNIHLPQGHGVTVQSLALCITVLIASFDDHVQNKLIDFTFARVESVYFDFHNYHFISTAKNHFMELYFDGV